MGIAEILMLVATVGGSVFSFFRATKEERRAKAIRNAREIISLSVGAVVRELEATFRKRYPGKLTQGQAAEIAAQAMGMAMVALGKQQKAIESVLGVPLAQIVRGEIEAAVGHVKYAPLAPF